MYHSFLPSIGKERLFLEVARILQRKVRTRNLA